MGNDEMMSNHAISQMLHQGAHRVLGAPFMAVCIVMCAALNMMTSCEPEPPLYLHGDGNTGGSEYYDIDLDLDLDLNVYWDYEIVYGVTYDWQAEWVYGWDEEDEYIFGDQGYSLPSKFNLRRYFTGDIADGTHTSVLEDVVNGYTFHSKYKYGFWDLLVWNDIPNDVQSLIFDESNLEYVTAYTNQTMNSASYNAPQYTRSFNQPEELFAAYDHALEINRNHEGFVYDSLRNAYVKSLEMQLEPLTYIYLTQVILHHNNGKISQVDGYSNLSSMARTTKLNDGVAGNDAITVNYNVRLKKGCTMKRAGKDDENVDVIGGRLLTFGLCGMNANRVTTRSGRTRVDDGKKHYMDVTMQFNNGTDSTFVFDVTDQVQKRFKGGVITMELDMDTIPVPKKSGGSGFDATVKDWEDGGTNEFPM